MKEHFQFISEPFREILALIVHWLPFLLVVAAVIGLLSLARYFLLARQAETHGENRLARQLIMLGLTGAGLIFIILGMPIGDAARGQLLSLLGLVVTAAIALSSTTFLGNAMAGLMLRAVRNFRPGDFVQVGEHFGRVSERGLLHTEIQTEDRDLTTLPNLYLVTNPVRVVRYSGTVVSATVSLGYDVPRKRVLNCLKIAGEEAGLEDPFVQILELGDFSITYRIAGILREVKVLITARSKLRECMLDTLHDDGIEIVSPTFMNQRQLPLDRVFIPKKERNVEPEPEEEPVPEEQIFDKAEVAEERASIQEALTATAKELAALMEAKDIPESERGEAERQKEALRVRIEELKAQLEAEPQEEETNGDEKASE
ncbi:MAG: mechanosensitive ion channel [Chrysiogenetes bacterium]|nr:mechanosensitive ion channel [Chrysiogenetes bacterium]